jgi:hypothetical protein
MVFKAYPISFIRLYGPCVKDLCAAYLGLSPNPDHNIVVKSRFPPLPWQTKLCAILYLCVNLTNGYRVGLPPVF